jgi:competence protein CoiA
VFHLSNVALNTAGEPILADRVSPADWEALKAGHRLEIFRMSCCSSPAILKTSSNGLPFFAHYNGECATAPETIWHSEAKALIVANLAVLGFQSREEVMSENKDVLWKADTYFEVGGRRIVIELQRSYQHLKDFLRRQQRYADTGVESCWLLTQTLQVNESGKGLCGLFRLIQTRRPRTGRLAGQPPCG